MSQEEMVPNALKSPNIDRHVHLEGSVDPAWVRRRVGAVPPALESFWRGGTLPFEDFIDSFFFVTDLLTTADAIRQAVNAIVGRLPEDCAGGGADVWCSPQTLIDRKTIKLDEFWKGAELGVADAAARGVKIALVLDAVNNFGPTNGHALLDLVANDLPPFVVGFSTGGLEQVPFRLWAPVFDRARALGLRCAAHAGENGPAQNIREAIEEAGLCRIVHAVRAVDDPAVLELLAEREIDVDVCITSNFALVPGLVQHPIQAMMQTGIMRALDTDDPGIIQTAMENEWQRASLLLGEEALVQRLIDDGTSFAPVSGLGQHPIKAMMAAGVKCALGTDDPGIIHTTMENEWQKASALLGDAALMRRLCDNAVSGAWCIEAKGPRG